MSLDIDLGIVSLEEELNEIVSLCLLLVVICVTLSLQLVLIVLILKVLISETSLVEIFTKEAFLIACTQL